MKPFCMSACCIAMLLAVAGLTMPSSTADAAGGVRQVFVTETGPMPSSLVRLDPEGQKTRDRFLIDTAKIRRALAGKQAALQAVYSSGRGNIAAATKLGEEIFDLREQLRMKALATGIPFNILTNGMEDRGCQANAVTDSNNK